MKADIQETCLDEDFYPYSICLFFPDAASIAWTQTLNFKPFFKKALKLKRQMEYGRRLNGRQSELPKPLIFTFNRIALGTLFE